ncbi:MAG: amidohydrolase [Cyclobacteriaceae bacterium]|nr:amidohydrolase [Cyclobacteriaceae bacterium]
MKSLLLFIVVVLFAFCSHPEQTADTIYFNGTIYTMATPGIAQAVAVRAGKILAVGSSAEVEKYKGQTTRMVDLAGNTMTPGFIEGHAHFMGVGYNKLELDLSGITSFEEIVRLVEEKAKTLAPGIWITGRGWHQDKWDSLPNEMVQGFPGHDELSKVTPNNPVFLRHASGHMGLANARAMELAGVSPASESPAGGEIIKTKVGQPTGLFNETAQGIIGSVIPQKDEQSNQMAYEEAVKECLSNGITGFHDAGVGQTTIDLYKRNFSDGKPGVRLYVMLDGSDNELVNRYFSIGPEIGLYNDFLTVRSIKLYSDGALGSRGAWLLEPYSDMPATLGQSTTDPEAIYKMSVHALEHGFQVCTHAIGDRANREVLDQYEKAFKTHGDDQKLYRFRIEHAQHIHPNDIPRFAHLGVIPAMQAIHMSSDRPWAIDRLGEKRIIEGAYVWQQLLESGAIIVNGTDAPVEPVNPIACFYASVTRQTLKGTPEGGYEPSQRMTREQALRSYTLDAAYAAFEEEKHGSIEAGKYADFTILSQDIMTVPDSALLGTRVLMTIVDGHVAYSDGTIK